MQRRRATRAPPLAAGLPSHHRAGAIKDWDAGREVGGSPARVSAEAEWRAARRRGDDKVGHLRVAQEEGRGSALDPSAMRERGSGLYLAGFGYRRRTSAEPPPAHEDVRGEEANVTLEWRGRRRTG
nr:unnamed protein product [Digitaria exilis]